MADFVLSPVLQVIFDRLASPVIQKVGDICDLKENFQKLQDALVMVQAVLEDAEEKQLCSKTVKIWLSNLKDAAYDAEDLLDLLTRAEITQDEIMSLRYSETVRKVLEKVEKIATDGLNFHLKVGRMINDGSDKRGTSSFIIEPEIYGRKEDREKTVKMLLPCQIPQEENVSFIAIIGLGGLGKTTLAQIVYNDERVMQHFDIRVWVFVSDDFDVRMIMKSVIESATNDKCDISRMEVLQSKLWGLLHRKRYLIVLDDVWTEDNDEWDKLRPLFRGGVDGSQIIVTTRSRKVAFMFDSPTFPYYLEALPEEDCWALFKQRAFRRGEDKRYPNLLPIGKEIVKKCGGVPLAAKTLGSLMRYNREESEWLFVQNSELWKLDVSRTGILPALRLSYLHLPSHLKPCLVFCSIFPRKCEIKKEKLIHLWMAEGFIQSEEGGKAPEDIGNDYFNDLLWMSFFQDVEKRDDGSVTGYRMHDIIHDLAQSLAGKESVIFEHGSRPNSCEKIRHSSVVSDFRSSTIPDALFEATRLRTLFLFSGSKLGDSICKLFSRFKYLRVLDLNGSGLTSLDESIGCLVCLRYLDLSRTLVEMLPDAIKKLIYLQTLKLINCYNLRSLPDLKRMENLRHLNITGCIALTRTLPSRVNNIWLMDLFEFQSQLQTLPMIVVGGLQDLDFLGGLKLRGQLHITQLERVRIPAWAKLAKMREKDNLESLGLYWGNNVKDVAHPEMIYVNRELPDSSGPSQWSEADAAVGEKVIMGLQPHQNLKRLIVKGYPGLRFPNWTLPNLIMVDLTNCMRCEGLPALGNLLLLKALSLRGMHGLKCIGKEFYGDGTGNPFPSLKELVLRDLPNLECWSSADAEEAFPSLSKLIVNKCPNLTEMPLFRTLQHLELRECRANVLNSVERLTALSIFAIEKVPELLSLSGGFLANNPLLSSLEIISCPQLSSLPSELENLTALKSLRVRWCEGLLSLPKGIQNLKYLESLEISDCHGIISMPDDGIGGLSSLRTLSIENCSNLTSLSTSFQHLISLEHLTIMYCPSLNSLPKDAQLLCSLRSLTILSCPELTSLPEGLQCVKMLHCLEIRSCSGLAALPEWFKDLVSLRSLIVSDCQNLKKLPEGLKLPTALQHLSIQDCPELEESCRQDWSNISHIPYKYIGSPEIRHSTAATTSSS